MTELYNNYGTIECKIILDADNKKKVLEVVIVYLSKTRRIVGVPNLDLVCFCRKNESPSFAGVSQNLVAAFDATIKVAEIVVDDCCECWDVTTNLTEVNGLRLHELEEYKAEYIPF